ncbi:MAG: hypothetical protein RR328_04880, partial [Bacteroidales bacterium]
MDEINKFWSLVDAHASKDAVHFIAQVVSVDERERSCEAKINDQISYEDVRLFSVINKDLKGFFVVPKVDSLVLVSRLGDSNELFVSMFSEVDKIIGSIGAKMEILVDEKGLQYTNDKVKCTLSDTLAECVSDKVKIRVENNKVSIAGADEVALNGTSNKGLVKIKELEENLKALKDYVEAMNTALPPAFTAIGAAMAAVGANGTTTYQGGMAGKIILFKKMEND